jgi:hypothetical protein
VIPLILRALPPITLFNRTSFLLCGFPGPGD